MGQLRGVWHEITTCPYRALGQEMDLHGGECILRMQKALGSKQNTINKKTKYQDCSTMLNSFKVNTYKHLHRIIIALQTAV